MFWAGMTQTCVGTPSTGSPEPSSSADGSGEPSYVMRFRAGEGRGVAMSETNALSSPDSLTGPSLAADTEATRAFHLAGHALFEVIDVGGMGEVYRCGDDALQRDLAIKILRAELRGDAGAEARFLREARLTGSLQHPGIVPVHHLGRLADGRPCYTMKLVRDEPAGPERLPRLLAIVEKVAQAVAFAHSKGVLHRDLKPSNIMVGEFGEVQVMDWGLAKQLSCVEPAPPPDEATQDVETVGRAEEAEGLSRAGAALGTPAYMPPEQAAGDWDIVDERADVFALGAILCEVLTGRPPYHGASRDDLLRRARRGDLAEALGRLKRCGADAALVVLCRDCLAPEREGRPRQAGVVAERLASYQAEVRERLRQAELERARAGCGRPWRWRRCCCCRVVRRCGGRRSGGRPRPNGTLPSGRLRPTERSPW
jgi:hypothetical protein